MAKAGSKSDIYRQIRAKFHQHLDRKRKGRHLIVQKELIPAMEQLALQPAFFWNFLGQLKRAPRKFARSSEMGLLHAKDFTALVVRVR
jgi:hypothetical protein